MLGDRTGAFIAAYAADGPWGGLFGRAAGFLGTELAGCAVGTLHRVLGAAWPDRSPWRAHTPMA